MKKTLFLTIIAVLLTLSGCDQKNDEAQTKIQELQNTVGQQQATIDELKSQSESEEEPTSKIPRNFLAVYGMDSQVMNEEINFYLTLPEGLPLLDQLKFLASKLSQHKFSGLPIEILKIEEREEETIAIINLKEITPDSLTSWKTGYFQGSAGGVATSTTLTRTFLQEAHPGEWIDGVEFYYEGQPIGDLDHLDLKGVKYRP